MIKDYENRETLTVQEQVELYVMKSEENFERREQILNKAAIYQLYEEVLLEEEENNKKERYNRKKEKYDKIKDKIGDEIDEELIKAKERLHENITQRIKYFEEKEMLTVREAQELEDLKRPEKLDEEELLMEEYIIHEIYQEQFDKENNETIEKRDTKGKNKEIEKPPIKLDLEKEDEYTTGTVE